MNKSNFCIKYRKCSDNSSWEQWWWYIIKLWNYVIGKEW